MSGAAELPGAARQPIPEFAQIGGHPKPLWMLFMTEFWERFAFYGMRWALVLYIVAQFANQGMGEAEASKIYGAYLALVYAVAVFGGYVADRVIGYQRSIMLGAVVMAAGLFMVALPQLDLFKLGLATIVAGNGLFKPNISTMVGKLYAQGDERRDSAFTIFYMGINAGAFVAPILTGFLARTVFGQQTLPDYQAVFIASGVGMLISLVWFWFGKAQLKTVGLPPAEGNQTMRLLLVILGLAVAIPVIYFLLTIDATDLQRFVLFPLFALLCIALLVEGFRVGKVARDMVIAMLIIFAVPYLVWRLCRTDYWAPLVVVQIVGGILLGPGVLGRAFPDGFDPSNMVGTQGQANASGSGSVSRSEKVDLTIAAPAGELDALTAEDELARYLLDRLTGEQVAAITFLASDEAAYVNGHELVVDGGTDGRGELIDHLLLVESRADHHHIEFDGGARAGQSELGG